MTPEMEHLYRAAMTSDQAWPDAMTRQFGNRADDARYDRRGVSTPEMKALHQNFRAANDAWLDAVRSHRKQGSARLRAAIPISSLRHKGPSCLLDSFHCPG